MSTLEAMVEQCDECGEELEIGQIGICDGCQNEKTEFKFDELSDEAKEKARDDLRYNGDYPYDEWWDSVYEDAVTVGKLIGIEVGERTYKTSKGASRSETDINFSGFSSQGDGCCYSGTLVIADLKNCVADLKTYAGEGDTKLFMLAAEGEALYNTIMLNLLKVRMLGGAEYDDYGDEIEHVTLNRRITIHGEQKSCFSTQTACDNIDEELQIAMDEYVSGFADWIYKQLDAEYDYLNSDEHIDEELAARETIFDANGSSI